MTIHVPVLPLPSLSEIEEVRRERFRPTVVACMLFNKRLLFLLKYQQRSWILPQGGVEQGETITDALSRELQEELGTELIRDSFEPQLLKVEKVAFSSKSSLNREVLLADGQAIKMIGKCFYIMMVLAKRSWIPLKKSEYDRYNWLDYSEAKQRVVQTSSEAKKTLLLNTLELLKEHGHLAA